MVCCCFFLMIDHLHVKHSSCEENYAFRSKKVTRSTTFGPKRYHLSSPQNLWPHRMGCASLTTWFPFPLKVRLNQPAFTTTKKTQFHLRKMWFDVEEGDQLRQSDLEVPLGLGCLVLPRGCSFMIALHETLSTYWTNQSSHGWSIVASKRLGQTCPHPMPYCTVRIVLL